jgi:SH3-like domain-containing protein
MKTRPSVPLRTIVLLAICFSAALDHGAFAGDGAINAQYGNAQYRGSGLPLPRFATLKADEVNVRTGPGPRFPVEWILKRKGMPVEIVAEYETWRKIRDSQGTSGWLYQGLLSGKRSFIVASKAASLHKTPAPSAEVVAMLEPEVVGEIRSCVGEWCRVRASGISGWIKRTDIWGTYKSEPID